METIERQLLAQGGIHPRGWPQGKAQLRAECLIEGQEPEIEVAVRFAQTVERQVLDADGEPVEDLLVAGKRYISGPETAEHELRVATLPDRTAMVRTAGGKAIELIERGAVAGGLRWSWEALHCTVEAWIDGLDPGVRRIRVEVSNRLEWDGGGRERTLMRTLHSPQVTMHSADGAFASLADPPRHLRGQSATCRNDGLWPVPVGEAGDRRTMLAAPIRLEDYPARLPAPIQVRRAA